MRDCGYEFCSECRERCWRNCTRWITLRAATPYMVLPQPVDFTQLLKIPSGDNTYKEISKQEITEYLQVAPSKLWQLRDNAIILSNKHCVCTQEIGDDEEEIRRIIRKIGRYAVENKLNILTASVKLKRENICLNYED